jgi:hypothetical protein
MFFTVKTKHNSIINQNNEIQRQNNSLIRPGNITMANFNLEKNRYIENQSKALTQKEPEPVDDSAKKMKWGPPIWYLFHTLSEKIKPETFMNIKTDLLNMFYTICTNLPCPMCASHATDYMNKINFNAIQTKEQMKDLFFIFHNSVNKKKGYKQFTKEDLDTKYYMANTINIIRNFMHYFKDKHASIRMIADDLHRQRLAVSMQDWFNKNISYFEI